MRELKEKWGLSQASTASGRTVPFFLKGFSLIELLTVIGIIVILAGIIIPIAYRAEKRGLIHKARADISKIELAVESYKTDMGYDPVTNDMDRIITWLTGVNLNGSLLTVTYGTVYNVRDGELMWRGPYVDVYAIDRDTSGRVIDPWGVHYSFNALNPVHNTATYDIYSAGPDRDGSTTADNITNWGRGQ